MTQNYEMIRTIRFVICCTQNQRGVREVSNSNGGSQKKYSGDFALFVLMNVLCTTHPTLYNCNTAHKYLPNSK